MEFETDASVAALTFLVAVAGQEWQDRWVYHGSRLASKANQAPSRGLIARGKKAFGNISVKSSTVHRTYTRNTS